MKRLLTLEESAQRERVEKFLDENYIGSFVISDRPNSDGKYEVSSKVYVTIKNQQLTVLATEDFIFTKLFSFNCPGCPQLQTLQGAPQEVEKFYCSYCKSLQSLEGAPKEVKIFDCTNCDSLQSLDEMPVCDTLWCDERFKNSIPKGRIKKQVIFQD